MSLRARRTISQGVACGPMWCASSASTWTRPPGAAAPAARAAPAVAAGRSERLGAGKANGGAGGAATTGSAGTPGVAGGTSSGGAGPGGASASSANNTAGSPSLAGAHSASAGAGTAGAKSAAAVSGDIEGTEVNRRDSRCSIQEARGGQQPRGTLVGLLLAGLVALVRRHRRNARVTRVQLASCTLVSNDAAVD